MSKQLSWADAIQKVLQESGPLHYAEITQKIIEQGLRHDLGATPAASVGSILSSSIKKEGASSPYVRVVPGTYALASSLPSGAIVVAPDEPFDDESDPDIGPQRQVITSFGMFWQRDLIDWNRSPKLLGHQEGGVEVNFSAQRGLYLLYDGREVIYVGRSTERPLGQRLFEHTKDRLAVRWDRFSWFGLLPVNGDGTLGILPESYSREYLIQALEALLIEAVEPRQNRQRGDDMTSYEFLQKEDPELKTRKLYSELGNVLNKK